MTRSSTKPFGEALRTLMDERVVMFRRVHKQAVESRIRKCTLLARRETHVDADTTSACHINATQRSTWVKLSALVKKARQSPYAWQSSARSWTAISLTRPRKKKQSPIPTKIMRVSPVTTSPVAERTPRWPFFFSLATGAVRSSRK